MTVHTSLLKSPLLNHSHLMSMLHFTKNTKTIKRSFPLAPTTSTCICLYMFFPIINNELFMLLLHLCSRFQSSTQTSRPFNIYYNFPRLINFAIKMGYFSFLKTRTQPHLILQFLPHFSCSLNKYVNSSRELTTSSVPKSSPPVLSLAHTSDAFYPHYATETAPVKGPVDFMWTNAPVVSFQFSFYT